MRKEKKKEEKSHNTVEKSKRYSVRQRKKSYRKRISLEERSDQVNRQIMIIVLGCVLAIIAVIGIIVYKKTVGMDEQIGVCKNGEYVGDREIELKGLNQAKTEEETLPEYDLYEATRGMSAQNRFEFYKDAVGDIIYPEAIRSSDRLEGLPENEQNQWNTLFMKIELEESKKGNAENVAELQELSQEEYRYIYELCYQAYCDLPQGNMATRYGRNAGDALKIGLQEDVDRLQLIEDFNHSNEGYVTSFYYRDCEQKKADGCYWAGNNYYQFLYNYSEATEQEKEHLALMAYFFSDYGEKCSEEEGVQHRNDLKEIKAEIRRILIEQYDYSVVLFSE